MFVNILDLIYYNNILSKTDIMNIKYKYFRKL